GLIYYNPEKKTLNTRRRGKIRNIEMPYEMLYYIIMNRLDNVRHPFFTTKREYFEEYVANKISSEKLGSRVSSKLIDEVERLEWENESLKRDEKIFEEMSQALLAIDGVLRKHGHSTRIRSWNKPYYSEHAEILDEAQSSKVSPNLADDIEKIRSISERLYNNLTEKERV